MSNLDIARKFSISNSASTSITSENPSNEQSLTWSLTLEGEARTPTEDVQPPQYSWRKKQTGSQCNEITSESVPSFAVTKKNVNLEHLLRNKYEILRQIALHYSRLAGLMRDELDLTGIEPVGYAESMKAYEKAVDDFECGQIFMDSISITAKQEPEVNSELEKKLFSGETSYVLSPRMLGKITYGSLQNFVQAHEPEGKSSVEVIDLTKDNSPRNRPNSIPREVFPPALPRSATISAGSISSTTFQPRHLVSAETSDKGPTLASAASRLALRRFFSLKSLSESLPIVDSRPSSGTTRRSVDANDDIESADLSSHSSLQPRRAISRTEPKKLDELINWKNMEIATVQNILRANLKKAKDSVICRKSRRAYRGCANENQKTLLRLHRENEELKEARQSALALRSQSVGRFETSHSQPPPMVYGVSPPPFPLQDDYDHTFHSHKNFPSNIDGDAVSETTSFHADGQSSDSSHSSSKQAQHSELTLSCQSSESSRTNNSVPSIRKDISSPALSSRSPFAHIQDISSENQSPNRLNNGQSPKSSVDCVQYLFPNQMNQQSMRSYGRPNYSRHGSVSFGRANRPEELNQLPRFYPIQDSHFKIISAYSGYQSPPIFQSSPQHRLVQYTCFANPNPSVLTVSTSQTHFKTNTNNYLRDVRPNSRPEHLTNPSNQQSASPEVTPTPTSKPRFTLADKLNMCTSYSTTSTSFH